MARYEGEIIETRQVRCRYTVEASRLEDAVDAMQRGETINAVELRTEEVSNRTLVPSSLRGLPEPNGAQSP